MIMGSPYILLPAAPNGPDPQLSINSNFNCDVELIKLQTESGNDIFKPITVTVMNCQRNKKAVYNVFIDEHQPDIIIYRIRVLDISRSSLQ